MELFQSAPGGEAGGNEVTWKGWTDKAGFNPPPAVRPGETDPWLQARRALLFQSAPGGEAGGNVADRCPVFHNRLFQSAPGGEAGGNFSS